MLCCKYTQRREYYENILITNKIDQSRTSKLMTFSKLIRRNVCENGKLLLASESDYLKSRFELIGYFDLIIVEWSRCKS